MGDHPVDVVLLHRGGEHTPRPQAVPKGVKQPKGSSSNKHRFVDADADAIGQRTLLEVGMKRKKPPCD
eukprot:4036525-Prymnesium_polylepis.1